MCIALSEIVWPSEREPRSWSWSAWRSPFLIWIDGVEEGWAIPCLVVGFVALWMAYLSIAYIGGDLHQDVLETWTLGRSFDWGSSKHPPLMGWVARAWTSVFPLTEAPAAFERVAGRGKHGKVVLEVGTD